MAALTCSWVVGSVVCRWGLGGHAPQPTALAVGQAAPYAEALVVGQGGTEALDLHQAPAADVLGGPGRFALLREEGIRVYLGAERPFAPVVESPRHDPGDGREREDFGGDPHQCPAWMAGGGRSPRVTDTGRHDRCRLSATGACLSTTSSMT